MSKAVEKTVKDKLAEAGRISIKPYTDSTKENMGLEDYGMVVFPGVHQREDMACLVENGSIRYLNGLDESAPEVKSIQDDDKRNAKIREIRTIVADLEFEKHYVKLDIEDPNFWNKVQTYKPNNREFWSTIYFELNNIDITLMPTKKTEDLLKVLAIGAGGFPGIAKSYEDAKSGIKTRKWYLDRQIDTAESRVSVSKIKNKALRVLDEISDENPRKLFYVAKLVDVNSMQYRNRTLQNIIYDKMDAYINGNESESNIKKAANQFLSVAELDSKELKIRAMVKDCTFYKIIIQKGDGLLYLAKENVMLGRNAAEVYEKLENPLNEDILEKIQDQVESLWGQ